MTVCSGRLRARRWGRARWDRPVQSSGAARAAAGAVPAPRPRFASIAHLAWWDGVSHVVTRPGSRARHLTREIVPQPASTSLNPRARLPEVRARGLSDVLGGYPTISRTAAPGAASPRTPGRAFRPRERRLDHRGPTAHKWSKENAAMSLPNNLPGGETLLFRASSRRRFRCRTLLQQIWTRPRPGPSQEPHPHHSAPACPRHRDDPGPGVVVPGGKGSFRFRGSSIRWFFGGSAGLRGSPCSKSLELRSFHHAQKAFSAGEPEFAVGPGAEAAHADALAGRGPEFFGAAGGVVVHEAAPQRSDVARDLQAH